MQSVYYGPPFQETIALKMAARNFVLRCTTFFSRIPIESIKICNSNAMHLGKKFLAAIFSAILFFPALFDLVVVAAALCLDENPP